MPKRMLIDASHPEETRVVVLDGQRVDEFDFEAASKRPLKGNIYLAKVTRVEPSLQAAFVEYGGNRQGFLAFSEIHPDYYQIPVADRQALIAEQLEEARRRGDDEFESVATGTAAASDAELEAEEVPSEDRPDTDDHLGEREPESGADAGHGSEAVADGNAPGVEPIETLAEEESDEGIVDQQSAADAAVAEAEAESAEVWSNDSDQVQTEIIESSEDQPHADESAPLIETSQQEVRPVQPLRSQRPSQRWVRRRHYKIQEVIKRKQIMLVQVVKEERGTKGAALTTYLSLAGRYCVLMPNTPRGGGISRKITNATDRNRLKAAAATLELLEGMGLIIRTAGANRTKLEIKRDYEYLLRLWDQIRELTLQSNAPACVYEEGDIIKRAIRDLYNKDVSEILVEGDGGYKNAKDFMRMLMPSHAKNVKFYRDPVPIFQKQHIEAQLDAMFQPTVTLKSGGYIVINQTEALVSIDVNSGRATREHSIEETAHKTNLEAADEVARQLRLRDLAGLIVIDFIDMEDGRNDRDVEKRLRDAVKNDRARVQIGKISQFGLLEMSRQRLRAGVVASSTIPCPHCGGQGIVRSVESTSLRVLRAIEEEGQRGRAANVVVRVANEVALYTLNQKRRELARIETEYGMSVGFEPKDDLMAGNFDLERSGQRTALPPQQPSRAAVSADTVAPPPTDMVEEIDEANDARTEGDEAEHDSSAAATQSGQSQTGSSKKRRRRRRGRGGSSSQVQGATHTGSAEHPQQAGESAHEQRQEHQQPSVAPADATATESHQPGTSSSSRRRRRRRKPRSGTTAAAHAHEGGPVEQLLQSHGQAAASSPFGEPVMPNGPSQPVWSMGSDRAEAAAGALHELNYRRENELEGERTLPSAAFPNPQQSVTSGDKAEPASNENAARPQQETTEAQPEESQQPARRGWWQRTFQKS